jgi:Cu-Zn family superoxide dismutase
MFSSDRLPSPAVTAYGADLLPSNGSAASGGARIVARDDGVTLVVYLTNLAPGSARVVIHANGNCSSPNAFSAGAPWAPPGMRPEPLAIAVGSEGRATLSVRLRGYKLEGPDGLIGKAVVVHEPTGPLDAKPGVPNGRLACGVIGERHTLNF